MSGEKAKPHRPHCQKPSACDAKGAGHCRRCHMSAAVKANWQDPDFRARNAAATKASKAGAKGVEIPRWVPVDLHDEYLEAAAWQGEEFAASHCRRVLRELREHSGAYADQGARPAAGNSQSRVATE